MIKFDYGVSVTLKGKHRDHCSSPLQNDKVKVTLYIFDKRQQLLQKSVTPQTDILKTTINLKNDRT